MSGRLVEDQAMADVGWSLVVQGLVGVDEQLELAPLLYWEPVEFSEVRGDVGSPGEVEDESGSGVLCGLESLQKVCGESFVECVVVV